MTIHPVTVGVGVDVTVATKLTLEDVLCLEQNISPQGMHPEHKIHSHGQYV